MFNFLLVLFQSEQVSGNNQAPSQCQTWADWMLRLLFLLPVPGNSRVGSLPVSLPASDMGPLSPRAVDPISQAHGMHTAQWLDH